MSRERACVLGSRRRLAMAELAGKLAVVTGGAAGIGEAIVRELAREQARVVIADLDGERAAALAREVGGMSFAVDASDAAAVADLFARIDAQEEGIDILVNNVGGGPRRALEEMTLADWQSSLALNLTSAFVATRAVFDAMRRRGGGAIVNVASIAAHAVSPVSGAAYAAAKAGLIALTRQTAYEWAKYRIRANAVCPGPTRTRLTHASTRVDADFPLGAWVQPVDVARAVRFLASPCAAMCTGAVLNVDGGVSLL
jgi:NAD(P)-dependent dehydrogenase (short-subunit alcohol dehydrogenase family)